MRQALRVTALVMVLALAPATGWAAGGDSLSGSLGHGQTAPTVKSGWTQFGWDEGAEAGPFEFSSLETRYMIVVDIVCRGDRFAIYDNGALLGETSDVLIDPECDDGPVRLGPIESFNDPTYSSGVFLLEPGDHSITITVIVNPFGDGSAFLGLGFQPR